MRSGWRPRCQSERTFGAADLVDRLAQVLGDMEAVQDVKRVPRFLGGDLQIRFPHVAADERQGRGALLPEPAEELEQRLGASVLADPQQALARRVDLIDEREEMTAVLPMDLVDADRANPGEIHVIPGPHVTAIATDRNTWSQLVRNTRATSCQLRRLPQRAGNHM